MTLSKKNLKEQEFLIALSKCNMFLLNPEDIRKGFTEFVLKNKSKAMLPSRRFLLSKNLEDDIRF